MDLIKEYVERGIQTEVDTLPSPYADPAVVLAAPLLIRRAIAQEVPAGHHDSIPTPSPTGPDSTCHAPSSPVSPILAPFVSRRLSKRKLARYQAAGIVSRRIVSMPESRNDASSILSQIHGKRVVSMPDRVRPALEPSVELFQSPSVAAGDSFGSYSGHSERIQALRAPSDVPQTPSPPSSPESLLIIATGTQLPDGFLRRKYSPEPLLEEDEGDPDAYIHGYLPIGVTCTVPDWITWANSPPRPIPALHGPLSLPYARCPSGAEGTIIEEPDNVAQMIWGLGPDDLPHNQLRTEAHSSNPDNPQNAPPHGPNQVPPRLQKKRTPISQQVPKSSRTQTFAHTGHAKQSPARTQRQAYIDKRRPLSQVPPDVESPQEITDRLSWNDTQPMQAGVEVPDNPVNNADAFPADNSRILEWQLARLRQVLRTSLVDVDSYNAYPGRLEPVIPAALASGLPQSYPRIFVEPRPNDSVNSTTKQSPIELAQQYRQQQLYRQALQKQKLQIQNFLPTPPNSSSPQWSSHFSPYLTYCSTFSPELVGSVDHTAALPPQKFRCGSNPLQYLSHVYDRNEQDHVSDFDANTSISTPQILANVDSVVPLRQGSSSSTLAKYIKQLQALAPIANFSPLQQAPASNVPLATSRSIDENAVGAYHSPIIPTPPSPESPQTLSRRASYSARSMASMRPIQRRLSSVPEEDSATLLELSASVSSPGLPSQITTDIISSNHDIITGCQARYLDVPLTDVTRKPVVPDLPGFENNLGISSIAFCHDTSPVKVRLPATKEHDTPEQAGGYHEPSQVRQHGHRKKHRHRKIKGTATTNERAPTPGLVG